MNIAVQAAENFIAIDRGKMKNVCTQGRNIFIFEFQRNKSISVFFFLFILKSSSIMQIYDPFDLKLSK